MTNADEPTTDALGDIMVADGPWSLDQAPAGAEFYDFGPLQLPAFPGLKARVEIDPQRRTIGAVSVRVNDCEVQLQVLGARSGTGAWTDVRKAIIKNLQRRPGNQHVVEGRFGAEVIANLTSRDQGGLLHDTTMRFIGIDGDRWMLRAVVTGPSVSANATVEKVDALLSHIAIKRGTEAVGAGTVMELEAPPGTFDAETYQADRQAKGDQ